MEYLLLPLLDSTSQDSFISLESFRSTDMTGNKFMVFGLTHLFNYRHYLVYLDSSTHVTKIGPILLDYTKRAVYPKM